MGIKQDFIDAIRDTPDGIKSFLSVAIPSLAPTTLPTDKDSSQLAQGILAHNLNTILLLLVGFTPVEFGLRIGQHSNVSEAILLSCLEYIEESQTQKDFTIKEPVAGTTYAQGDIRVVISSKSKNIASVAVTASDEFQVIQDVSLTPDNFGTNYVGYARCDQKCNYTFDVTVVFNTTQNDNQQQTETKTGTVTVAVSDTEGEKVVDITEFDIAAMKAIAEADGLIGGDLISRTSDALEQAIGLLIQTVNAL
jgi:hypothetical protein